MLPVYGGAARKSPEKAVFGLSCPCSPLLRGIEPDSTASRVGFLACFLGAQGIAGMEAACCFSAPVRDGAEKAVRFVKTEIDRTASRG